MRLVLDAIVTSFEMMGIFFFAFFVIFLVALFLYPIETRLSEMVWKHSGHEVRKSVLKPTYKQFSQKHR